MFTATGTYTFEITEVIPETSISTGLVYDQSCYQIAITVSETTDADGDTILTVSSVSLTKTVDASGVEITATAADTIYFNNLAEAPDLADILFTKVSSTGGTLTGATFAITEMTSETDTKRPSGGYSLIVTSDANGLVLVPNLPTGTVTYDDDRAITSTTDTYYMMVETIAPAGHIISSGYWVIAVDYLGRVTIEEIDGANPIDETTLEIINYPETSSTLDITLTKSDQMANLLSGVTFLVERVIMVNDVPNSVNYGFEETYTTDENGSFTIEGLSADSVYMITEVTKPTDENSPLAEYQTFTGYWLIETTGNEYHPSLPISYTITEYDASHNKVSTVTDTLYNTKIEFLLPETGGSGIAHLQIAGGILLLLATLWFGYQRKKATATMPRDAKIARHWHTNTDPPLAGIPLKTNFKTRKSERKKR